MHYLYVAFEMLHVLENKPLRLAYWVITLYLSVRISSFEVTPFNVIHHLRRAAKRAHPLLVALRFVANADRALAVAKDKREWLEIGRGRFLLDERWLREGNPESVPSRHFAAAAEAEHKTCKVDPARNNLLRGDTSDMIADEFGQLRPLGDLMFNDWFGILLFLLSTVLPLDIFYRATAEVVRPELLRDNISPGVRAIPISEVRRRTSTSTSVPCIL